MVDIAALPNVTITAIKIATIEEATQKLEALDEELNNLLHEAEDNEDAGYLADAEILYSKATDIENEHTLLVEYIETTFGQQSRLST